MHHTSEIPGGTDCQALWGGSSTPVLCSVQDAAPTAPLALGGWVPKVSRLRVWRQLGSFVNRQNVKGILASREITLKTTFSIEKVEGEEEMVSGSLAFSVRMHFPVCLMSPDDGLHRETHPSKMQDISTALQGQSAPPQPLFSRGSHITFAYNVTRIHWKHPAHAPLRPSSFSEQLTHMP